jgi:hypothetical protein
MQQKDRASQVDLDLLVVGEHFKLRAQSKQLSSQCSGAMFSLRPQPIVIAFEAWDMRHETFIESAYKQVIW